MLDVEYRKHGLKLNAVWFCDNAADAFKKSRADIVFFHGISDPGIKRGIVIPQKTAVTPLDRPPDVIFGAFGSTCRNMIRQAESEALDVSVHEAADLKENPALLASFRRDYDDFVRVRGILNTYNPTALEKYVEKGGALLTQVSKDGQCYARHILVCDGLAARLLYSVSRFRDETLDRKLASNANAYLHWKEIGLLRDRGYRSYDWGGLTDGAEPNGVDFFKLKFKGETRFYYNVIAGRSALGRAAVFLLRLSGKKLYGV